MQRVEAYQASDGALFQTMAQCQQHEVSLVWRGKIDSFLDSDLCPYNRLTAQAGMLAKMVIAWEQYKERLKEVDALPASPGVSIDKGAAIDKATKIQIPLAHIQVKRKRNRTAATTTSSKPQVPHSSRARRA